MEYTTYDETIVGKTKDGRDVLRLTVQVNTAADIPDPADHPQWAAGSWLHVLEGGGSLYKLGTDRVWHPQSFTAAESTEVTA